MTARSPAPRTATARWRWVVPALLTLVSTAQAGMIFLPGTLTGEKFNVNKELQGPGYQVLYSTTQAEITDDRVQTRTLETLAGPTEGTVKMVGILPLPAGSVAGEAEVRLDGIPLEHRFLDATQAQDLLAELARATEASRLVAFAGKPVLLLPALELKRRARLEVLLRQPVVTRNGLSEATIVLPAAGFGSGPVRRMSVDATLATHKPLRVVFSPTHDIEVERPEDVHGARVRLSMDEVTEGQDLRLLFAADDDAVGLRLLTHRDEGEDHGYFLLLGNPTGGDGAAAAPKDLVLALDTSGSMRGEKIAQVQLAAEYVVSHLNPGDRFNIIAFGSEVKRFREDLVAADADQQTAARTFIQGLLAVGKTHISGALEAGLQGKAEAGRPRIMLFLTDGTPTVGELDPDAILAALPAKNQSETKIFALGVGHDVNAHLLDGLALGTQGQSVYVSPEEEIDVKVARLYDGLSYPVLTDVALDFGGLKVDHVYPDAPAALFRGQEILLTGRYTGGGSHTVTLKGSLRGEARTHTTTGDFPSAARPDEPFVAWLWASRRIGDVLREIRLKGQTAERVAEVVQLSQKFGIITEYTVFLSDAGRAFTPEEATAAAAGLMGTANAQASGRWAVQQADNENQMRSRKVSSVEMNMYKDRQGNLKQAAKVRTVEGRAYYERDGKWVDAASKAEKVRRVKKYSPEYFELIKKNKNFARAQSLGGDTVMDLDDERVETY